VYRGRSKASGQLVAIKVLDLLPNQFKRVEAALRECELLAGLQHESIVHIVTYHTAQVQRRQSIVEPV